MTSPAIPRLRFSPAPTGYLHVGGARTALFNWLYARKTGGAFLLRIEDTDPERSRQDLIDVIFRTLEWLGIDWDEEPVRQSQRSELYRAAAEKLFTGGLAYYCDCTKEQIDARAKERGGKPGYDGWCRHRNVEPGPGTALRFRTPDEGETTFDDVIRGRLSFPNADLEDFVILRADGTATFFLPNAVDDRDMGVTHVVRGEDLINVTPKVLLLRTALGDESLPLFAHLPLLVNQKRQKLSKRRDDVAVEDYRDRGYLPEAMRNYLAVLGWGPPDGVEIRPIEEIVQLFRLEDVTKASAFFDVQKLEHFNGEYIRALPVEEFIARVQPWLAAAPWPPECFDPAAFARLAPLVQERVTTLAEVPSWVDFLFLDEPAVDGQSWDKVMVRGPSAADVLDDALATYEACEWQAESIEAATRAMGERHGLNLKKTHFPVRVAVTGRQVGPPLWESLEVLGRDRVLARLRRAREQLGAA